MPVCYTGGYVCLFMSDFDINVKQNKIDGLGRDREHNLGGSALGRQSVTYFGELAEEVVGLDPSPPTPVSCLGRIRTTYLNGMYMGCTSMGRI